MIEQDGGLQGRRAMAPMMRKPPACGKSCCAVAATLVPAALDHRRRRARARSSSFPVNPRSPTTIEANGWREGG
jgi:hypothetical protein